MKPDNIDKVAGVGACGLWIALHGRLGWLLALYGICVMLDCLTGNILALKEKNGIPVKPAKDCGIRAGV